MLVDGAFAEAIDGDEDIISGLCPAERLWFRQKIETAALPRALAASIIKRQNYDRNFSIRTLAHHRGSTTLGLAKQAKTSECCCPTSGHLGNVG